MYVYCSVVCIDKTTCINRSKMPKINSYTISKKLEIIQWHKDNGSVCHRTSKHFGIDRKRIRDWLSKEEILMANNHGEKKQARKLASGRRPLSEELDDALFEFFEKERENGFAVSNRMLEDEALKIAASIGLLEFKASSMYIKRWKKRFNISMRRGTNESQKLPDDYVEAASSFLKTIRSFRIKNDYTHFNMCNMDQTMVRFDEPYSRTNDIVGKNSIRITNTGCKKRGFTVALAAAASGHKFAAFVILKEPAGRIPPRVMKELRIPNNVKVTCSVKGWMTTSLMEVWLRKIWGENEDDVRRMLILDSAPIHTSPGIKEKIENLDTDLVLIPGGCTSILQPADVSWMSPFKSALRREWASFIRLKQMTSSGNLKRPSRQDVLGFVSAAWEAVSENTIINSFKRCGISNELDGSEDGFFHSRLAEINVTSEQTDELNENDECIDLIFDSDSDDSFEGFSDTELYF